MTYRVVVTGIGVISPIGTGVDAFWKAVLGGKIGVDAISRFDVTSYPSRLAAEVRDFDPSDHMEKKRIRWTDRFAQFAIAAARGALTDAQMEFERGCSDVGVYVGSALGGVAFADEQHDIFRERGLGAVRPLLAISVFGGAATCNVALEFDLRGPTVANANSCAAGAVAIGDAFRAIRRGDVRAALAGGAEAPLSPLTYGAFAVIGAMSKRNNDPRHASRPFDLQRDGFVMAEGAGILVLERYEDAVSRGARIYGEIRGYGSSNDAHHMSAPRPDGASATNAMRTALREAELLPDEIEALNAHGSSTPLGDRVEAIAVRGVFGDDGGRRVPITASKGQHAHGLGTSAAWEAALSLLSIERGVLPGVVGLQVDDPDCDLGFVRETREHTVKTVLSNTTGFGGLNAALAFAAVDA
ncbi:MAG: beta-ketoacyl-[acyl-carrier-protein] synthase family protein [Vulcanimicrobiaceae bacterium]